MGISRRTGGAQGAAFMLSHCPQQLHPIEYFCMEWKLFVQLPKFSHSFQVWAMASQWTGWTPPRRRWPFGRRWCWLPTSGSRGCCRCAHWRGGKNWNNPSLVPEKCPLCSLGLGNFLHQGERDHPQGCKGQGDKAVKGQHLGGVNAKYWSTHGGHGRWQTWFWPRRNLICLFV